ncbi:MAG: N-acetylmuramoyl-L-alanine amidase [Candidatus Sericytochromatia bacterium]|nr:N-acetylmuramoyl-L-alanine amidase [Candidatus Sericytochromatia bacterium]
MIHRLGAAAPPVVPGAPRSELSAAVEAVAALARDAYAPLGASRIPKPAVVSMPSPHQSSRDGAAIDTIVLHHTASSGTAQAVGSWFQEPASRVSAHYTIGKDGTIVQSVEDAYQAWHAGESEFRGRGRVNQFSLGIEIVNVGDGQDPYTDAQYQALARLVAFMVTEYGIPRDRITGHKDVALPRGRKVDPSENFSYARLNELVDALLQGRLPAATAPLSPPPPPGWQAPGVLSPPPPPPPPGWQAPGVVPSALPPVAWPGALPAPAVSPPLPGASPAALPAAAVATYPLSPWQLAQLAAVQQQLALVAARLEVLARGYGVSVA